MAIQRLQLTRNQLAVIAHTDAESIRQLELLFSAVTLLIAPASASQAADDALATPITLAVAVEAGVYEVRSTIMVDTGAAGDVRITTANTAVVVDTLMAIRVDDKVIPVYWYSQLISSSSEITVDSSSAQALVETTALITVTKAGSLGFKIENVGGPTALLLGGSFVSVRKVG